MSDTINGSVYIFNTHIESVELALNGIDISTLAAAVDDDYTPPHISIERSDLQSRSNTPIFFATSNKLRVRYPYQTKTAVYTVTLRSHSYPIENDVYLYIFPGACRLVHDNQSIALVRETVG